MGTVAIARESVLRTLLARAGLSDQLLVVGGQLASGIGNLGFALIMARLLAPEVFTELARFLALYLVLHIPLNSISASSALAPQGMAEALKRVRRIGRMIAGAFVVASIPLALVLDIPVVASLGLAASAPAAGLLALERGRLYGVGRHLRAVASLVTEPAIRLTVGVALASLFGVWGGIVGIVLAGYVALVVARIDHRGSGGWAAHIERRDLTVEHRTGLTVATFALLALVQNQDLLLAGRLLPEGEAAGFAALSTLGGAAVFALATIPIVLLPRAVRGEHAALKNALGVAAVLGASAFLVTAVASEFIVTSVFGDRYAHIATLATPYVGAMALLGIARVLVANLCARGFGRTSVVIISAVGLVHLVLLVVGARSAAEVTSVTLMSTALLFAAAATATVVHLPGRPRVMSLERPRQPGVLFIALAMLGALLVRLVITRGIWLDEATTIYQIQLPLGEMLANLASTDVHPPLHYMVLWFSSRITGISEMGVRLPSILAGVALIPAVYVLGKQLYDEKTARVGAGLIAVAPFAVWYSQEARMYAFFMLFGVLAVYGQVVALKSARPSSWIIYAAASSALVWTQYMGGLLVMVQQAIFLWAMLQRHRRGETIKPFFLQWAAATTALALALLALAPLAYTQYTVNEQAGKGFSQVPAQTGSAASQVQGEVSIYSTIANGVWAIWGYHADRTMAQIAALWPLGMLGALLFLGRGRSTRTSLLAAAVVGPGLLLTAIGFFKPNLFEIRYVAMIVPLLILLVARAITNWSPHKLGATVAAAGLSLSMFAGLADQQLNGANPRRYDFRGALGEVSNLADEGDVVVYKPDMLESLVQYYAPYLDARRQIPEPRKGQRVFLVASFLDKPATEAQVDEVRAGLERRESLVDEMSFSNVRVWVYK
ncbi:MAG: glycosyltransferase family 39 protein [Actinomycetota bacterium]